MRAERIVRGVDIESEIETYNNILGEPGDLGCVLVIDEHGAALADDLASG